MKKSIFLIVIVFMTISWKVISVSKNMGSIPQNIDTSTDTSIDTSIDNPEKVVEDYSYIDSEPKKIEDIIIDGKWKLIWQDEFETKEIDNSKWIIINRKDNFNNELQYYTQDNASLKDGVLSITAKKEAKEGKDYTSALLSSRGKFSFKYGRIDVSARNPVGKGLFTAIWLLPDRAGKPYPEIDIMEMIGQEPSKIYGVVHYLQKGKVTKNYNITNLQSYNDYHLYSLEWDSSSLRWYVDGKLFHSTELGVSQENMYIILNLAVGGNWPGNPNAKTQFPSSFEIDYVRVYEEYKR